MDLHNLLLTVGYLVQPDTDDLYALEGGPRSRDAFQRQLKALVDDGLLAKQQLAARDVATGTTRRLAARWSLTEAGRAQIVHLHNCPPKIPRARQQRLLRHDGRTIRAIVALITLARLVGLRSVYLVYEQRLHPTERKPIADALIFITLGPVEGRPQSVPWSMDPRLADETVARIAIESDGDTEAFAVLRGKGVAYRHVHEDAAARRWWSTIGGAPPLVVWVAPHARRADEIAQHFSAGWPRGHTWIADDAGLAANSWRYWLHDGQTTHHTALQFVPPAPALLPPAPAPLPPAPAHRLSLAPVPLPPAPLMRQGQEPILLPLISDDAPESAYVPDWIWWADADRAPPVAAWLLDALRCGDGAALVLALAPLSTAIGLTCQALDWAARTSGRVLAAIWGALTWGYTVYEAYYAISRDDAAWMIGGLRLALAAGWFWVAWEQRATLAAWAAIAARLL